VYSHDWKEFLAFRAIKNVHFKACYPHTCVSGKFFAKSSAIGVAVWRIIGSVVADDVLLSIRFVVGFGINLDLRFLYILLITTTSSTSRNNLPGITEPNWPDRRHSSRKMLNWPIFSTELLISDAFAVKMIEKEKRR
jgi:hypothetical protein